MNRRPQLPDGWIAGLDVGVDQGAVNVTAVAAAGFEFVYIRAGDGLHDRDSQEARTVAACLATGLPFGLYFVAEPYGSKTATAQAAHWVSIAKDSGATLPAATDFELPGHGQPASDLLTTAADAGDALDDALGRRSILYASPGFLAGLEQLGGAPARAVAARLAQRPWWCANYGPKGITPAGNLARGWPSSPAPWGPAAIWQVSGDGGLTLPGGQGWVDFNVFQGSVGDLQALGT